jgi:acyl-CoA thioester hydrolase
MADSNNCQCEEPVEHLIRVRYAETDQMGVVYYANYLVWFEVARTQLCKARGFSYADMERETDSHLVVTEARCHYRAPARYDDVVRLRCWVHALRSRSLVFAYEARDEATGRLLAEGDTKHVVMTGDGRLKSFPRRYYDCLAGTSGVSEDA